MTDTKKLDVIELDRGSALRLYLRTVRDINKELYLELAFGADALQAALAETPLAESGDGFLSGVKQSLRAKQVANMIRRSADSSRFAAKEANRAWVLYKRFYAPEGDEKKRNRRKFDPNA